MCMCTSRCTDVLAGVHVCVCVCVCMCVCVCVCMVWCELDGYMLEICVLTLF